MAVILPKSTMFWQTIRNGQFFSTAVDQLLLQINHEFSSELERLKQAYSIKEPGSSSTTTTSPSRIVFGRDYDEVNRTLVGILALRWIHDDDYETFVGSQPDTIKLKRESFDWLREVFDTTQIHAEDLYVLVMSIVINDMGKDPQLAKDYEKATQENIANANHDLVLIKAVTADLIPCLDRLDSERKAEVLRGLELGAEFNFGQLAQAENVPACLAGLLEMRGHERAFDFRFKEQHLDIAGAAGHMDSTCAKKLIEPIFQAYRNVYDVATGIISGGLNLRTGYDVILSRRNELLQKVGYRQLSVDVPTQRALMRLMCMAGAADRETAELYDFAFNTVLNSETKEKLVGLLNIDGSVEEPAVQPTYMPAMLNWGTSTTKSGSQDEKVKALVALFHYLARVLEITVEIPPGVTVVERNVSMIKDDLSGGEWKKDPGKVLGLKEVPKDEISKREVP